MCGLRLTDETVLSKAQTVASCYVTDTLTIRSPPSSQTGEWRPRVQLKAPTAGSPRGTTQGTFLNSTRGCWASSAECAQREGGHHLAQAAHSPGLARLP